MRLKTRCKVRFGELTPLESGKWIYAPTEESNPQLEENELADLLEGPRSLELKQGGSLRVVRVRWMREKTIYTGWAPAKNFTLLDLPRPKLSDRKSK